MSDHPQDALQMANPSLSLPILESPSRIELGARCLRRHLLSDFLHLRTFASPSLAFGTKTHDMAEAWWDHLLRQGSTSVVALEAALDALEPWPEAADGGYHSLDLARTMTQEYVANARPTANSPHDDWELLDMERRYVIAYGEPPEQVYLTFKMDRVFASHERGELLIVDTKTSSRPGQRWADGMRMSIQQRLYNLMAQDLYGLPVGEHWIEGLDKKGRELHVGAIRYEQIDELWTDDYVNEAMDLAMDVAMRAQQAVIGAISDSDDVQDAEQRLLDIALTAAPFNLMDCHSYFVACPYLDLCKAPPSERVALVNGDHEMYQIEPWQLEVVNQAASSLPAPSATPTGEDPNA